MSRNLEDVTPEMHGKSGTYTNFGCRCDPCREANTRYSAQMRDKRLATRVLRNGVWYAIEAAVHGSYSTYVNWGCRCQACRFANTDRSRFIRDNK